MSNRELIYTLLLCITIICILAYFFYRSLVAIPLLSPIAIIIFRNREKESFRRKKDEISDDFKELLRSLNGSLQAGYSMENAMLEALCELNALLGNKSILLQELGAIKVGLDNNQDIGKLIMNMAKNTENEDIIEFAGIMKIAKETGGNIRGIINSYIGVIEQKNEVRKEIGTMITAKKYELKIMCVIPFFIIAYVQLTSPGFFDVLYHNLIGIIAMTFALILYGTGVYMGEKIMAIEV